MRRVLTLLGMLASIAYPLIVFLALDHWQPGAFALALLGLAVLRLAGGWQQPAVQLQVAVLLVLALLIYVRGSTGWLRYYPVVLNLGLGALFGWSLRHPPSIIERLAHLSEPELPAAAIRYTRRVTMLWCGFFVLNALVAGWTAWFASWEVWTLYNGLIAYLLIGLLLGGEWLFRQYWRARMADGVV
ncbi:hypothetical protein [Chitinilyticum piscinae]|uniref:DNA gyrase subunit B n=1 Tax=Chitinilyticum piscinae TaxID=2866724 RepID=A0A8J7KCE6_9NEIS|nr:hypothetical protein [Chitinilyticum piscinae]MBE9607824.1 hypothetical protein [Chitinilyticum piscinae]